MRASSTRRTILAASLLIVVPAGLLLLLLHLVLPRLREENFKRYFDRPRKITNEQFTLYAEADDPAGDAAADVLRTFLNHLYARWGDGERLDLVGQRELEHPVVVLLLRDHARLKDYHGPRYRTQTIEFNAGMYEPIAGTIALVSGRLSAPAELRRILCHEATHLVLDRLVRGGNHDWSLWLNEGLATYLEASRPLAGVGFRLGGLTPAHVDTVSERLPVSVADVLALTPADFTALDNRRAYALASVFIGFLLEGEGRRYEHRFWQYVAAERAPGPVAPGRFESVFRLPLGQLDAAFQAFVREQRYLR
ncbi:MAG: hypothetical protein JXQ29_07055 [Planctomycetes bacterium]|nr:hypothetical protein [Planctomycetota bacterium]